MSEVAVNLSSEELIRLGMSELAKKRWREATDEERQAHGDKIRKKRMRMSKAERVAIARKAGLAAGVNRRKRAKKKAN